MTTQDDPRPRANTTYRQRWDDPPIVPLRTVEALLREHPRLHLYGYGPHPVTKIEPGAYTELVSPGSRVRIAAALSWIEANLVPAARNSKRARSTYALKHCLERDVRLYVTNGEFICAALLSHVSIDTRYFNPLVFATLSTDTTKKGNAERAADNTR